MDLIIRIIAILIGIAMIIMLLVSFSRTAILNARKYDPINSAITRLVHFLVKHIFRSFKRTHDRQRLTTWFMPLYIFLQMAAWFLFGMLAFAPLYWATNAELTFWDAFVSSGSALSTLGFDTPANPQGQILAIIEGSLGLIIMVFFLTFIPGYQSAVQAREQQTAWLSRRVGSNPTGVDILLWVGNSVNANNRDAFWETWEGWFRQIRTTHTLAPEVVYTPSIFAGQSWVVCTGAILDAAAIYKTAVNPQSPAAAQMCFDEGVEMVRDVSATIGFASEKQPGSGSEITQAQYSDMLEALAAGGIHLVANSDTTWENFAAERATYMGALDYLSQETTTIGFIEHGERV